MLEEGEAAPLPSLASGGGGLAGTAAALAECEAVAAACELGLARTELLGQEQAAVAPSSSSGQLALYRLKVLDLRDRVRTYKALAFPSSSFSSSSSAPAPASTMAVSGGWTAFRRRPLKEVAEDLASEGNARGLAQVRERGRTSNAPP